MHGVRFDVALAMLLCLLASPALCAQERIVTYDSVVAIRADGGLDVTETIAVHAEGEQIRRGIYRDFPTRYRDRLGNAVVVDLQVLSVQRDGQPEPWFTERLSNGVRINTGNDDLLPVPATYTYTLRYHTARQLGFFADHDELYWNAIGTGWAFPIAAGSVEVRLPTPVPTTQLTTDGYTGAQGETSRGFVVHSPAPGVARWQLSGPLAPQQGLTVVLGFPKGLIAEPSRGQRVAWLLHDNRGVLIALLGLLALLGYCGWRWRRVGRDPRPGVIIARYQPPAARSPAGLRYLRRMRYDTRCFSADLLALAVAGQLRIERDGARRKDGWRLHRTGVAAADATMPAPQTVLLEKLFPAAATQLELRDANAATLARAHVAHGKALDARYQPALFQLNVGSTVIAFLIAALALGLALAFGGGSGVPAIIAIALLMAATIVVFGMLVKAPTAAGRALLDEIEGFKRYLSVAERDDLGRLQGPDAAPALDAKRYEALLPYAVALDVEEAWTAKFTLAVGAAAAAAATAGIAWYRGGAVSDLGSLSRAVGSGLSAQIASASSPPGSSSGSGGGGFSGGGGGGGGGGGR